jgi:hypothetical protein
VYSVGDRRILLDIVEDLGVATIKECERLDSCEASKLTISGNCQSHISDPVRSAWMINQKGRLQLNTPIVNGLFAGRCAECIDRPPMSARSATSNSGCG